MSLQSVPALAAALAASAAALLLLSGCGLPDEVVKQAESLGSRIDREAEAVDTKAGELERFIEDEDRDWLRPYQEREDWARSFAEARSEIGHARGLFAAEVAPRLEADRADDEAALREQLTRVRGSLDRAVELAREPARRAAFLQDVRDRAPELVRDGERALAEARSASRALATEVDRAARDYPLKAEDLAGRLAAVERTTAEASDSQEVAERELRAMGRGDADLAQLGDSAVAVVAAAATVASRDAEVRQKISELYRSYSKTLIDMKEVGTIEIGRTSWNESYDFPRETEVRFKVQVSPEDLESFEAWGDRPIAKLSSFFGRVSLNVAIDRRLWDSLRIDPRTRMPRGDDSAEFWVGESTALYHHRYTIVEGSESRETDWEQVSEETYEEHYDDLGMDIVAKPYGMYEDETLREAAPPGMAYVGNPKYGKWENDAQGRRHWSFGQSFLFYHLMFGGRRHHYYYNDWNHYRGNRAGGWYGRDPARATYGTYGSRTRDSSRYASTGFARGGGFRRADRSVRGAGSRGRGGGPGGGGK